MEVFWRRFSELQALTMMAWYEDLEFVKLTTLDGIEVVHTFLHGRCFDDAAYVGADTLFMSWYRVVGGGE